MHNDEEVLAGIEEAKRTGVKFGDFFPELVALMARLEEGGEHSAAPLS